MNVLELRRRTLGKGVYKKTVEGNPAIAQGSLARMYPGITMQGWTEQAQYEGKNLLNNNPNSWVVGKSISWSAVTGTPIAYDGSGISGASILIDGIKPNTKYSFKNLNISAVWVNRIVFADNSGNGYQNVNLYKNVETQNHEEYSVTSANNENITCAYFQVRTLPGESGENVAITEKDIKDMLVCFSKGEPIYEPYTGGAPSPSPEYPQEIKNAGKYNEDTQKWEYEITIANAQTDPDKNQTVTLTADRPLTKWDKLEKRNGQWGWVFKSGTMTLDGTQLLAVYNNGFYFLKSDNWNTEAKDAYSDKLINKNRKNIRGIPHFSESFGNKNYCYVLSVSEIYGSTTGEIKQNLSQNPITFYYETAEETFVPLSESEQEQMNALHTFRPTTVLSNDCGCNMTLTYKTKKSLEVAT